MGQIVLYSLNKSKVQNLSRHFCIRTLLFLLSSHLYLLMTPVAPFRPGINICPEWSHHKWTALSSGGIPSATPHSEVFWEQCVHNLLAVGTWMRKWHWRTTYSANVFWWSAFIFWNVLVLMNTQRVLQHSFAIHPFPHTFIQCTGSTFSIIYHSDTAGRAGRAVRSDLGFSVSALWGETGFEPVLVSGMNW